MEAKGVYPPLRNGEPKYIYKGDMGILIACCDCGLVHKVTFEDDPTDSRVLVTRWYRRVNKTAIQRQLRGVSATITRKENS